MTKYKCFMCGHVGTGSVDKQGNKVCAKCRSGCLNIIDDIQQKPISKAKKPEYVAPVSVKRQTFLERVKKFLGA